MPVKRRHTQTKLCPTCKNFGRVVVSLIDPRAAQCAVCRNSKTPSDPALQPRLTDSIVETATGRDITKAVYERVRSLEDLVRVCDIDLSVWEVGTWEANKWEVGAAPRATGKSGEWARETADIIVTPLYQVKARLKRISVENKTLQLLSEGLIADIRAEVRKAPKLFTVRNVDKRYVDDGFLFEFAPFDLHLGKFAWSDETVANYDVDIAEDLFKQSLDFLLNGGLKLTSNKIAKVLCVFGNDVSHVDSKNLQTTAGTPMDYDSRYIRVYRRITAVHRWAVDQLRQVAPVDVVIVPGNHDELTSFHMGEILATRYETDPHVSVDNGPRLRKYYEHGKNLLGFAHGDSERVGELPLTMAREQKDAWARCTEREWQIGHKHIVEGWETRRGRKEFYKADRPGLIEQDLYSDKGVRIRRLTSLSGHDAWHTKHAYMDRRACEAFVFHKSAGFTGQLSFNIEHMTGKGMLAE